MGEIVDIEEAMPHVVVIGRNNEVHVMPRCLIIDVINRRISITDIEDWENFLPEILDDRLSNL